MRKSRDTPGPSLRQWLRKAVMADTSAMALMMVLTLQATRVLAQDAIELPAVEVTADTGTPDENASAGTGPSIDMNQAASAFSVTGQQINQLIFSRPAEALEIVPGLIITQHSGEGKANQYYLRGFNLDHGTDFAIFVDGMPINMRTHGHGQGYTDLNFLIPELISSANIKKGPYFADEGDFASVGAVHIDLLDSLNKNMLKATIGEFGYVRYLGIGTANAGEGDLLVAGEVGAYDGPWTYPDNMRKLNGLMRYSQGNALNGFSLTGMAYGNQWRSTDQIPERAVPIIGLFGTLDPTDGGNTTRFSLSGRWAKSDATSLSQVDVFAIRTTLNLFNNFTYFLSDPVFGDQFHQHDDREVLGIYGSHTIKSSFGDMPTETTFGVQTRFDNINVGLDNRFQRQFLFPMTEDQVNPVRDDRVREGSVGFYAQSTLHVTDWARATFGWRGDVYATNVNSLSNSNNSGNAAAFLGSPKGSFVFGPFEKTEFYADIGQGFHSNDARGTTITQDPSDPAQFASRVPFLVPTQGAEIGVRTKAIEGLNSSASLFILDSASEILFVGDAGTTEASRPSRRIGIELTNDYRPVSWLDLEADFSYTRARFLGYDFDQAAAFTELAGFPEAQIGNGPGNFIPGAPAIIAKIGLTLGEKTGWFGALNWRYFGPRPLTEDNAFVSPATGVLNARVGYTFDNDWRLQLDAFNVTNSRSDQITYAYGSLLKTDSLFTACNGPTPPPAAVCETGVMDRVFHPLEPVALRVTLVGQF